MNAARRWPGVATGAKRILAGVYRSGAAVVTFRQDERCLGIEYDHHNRPETPSTDVMGREHHTEYSGHDLPVKMRGAPAVSQCGYSGSSTINRAASSAPAPGAEGSPLRPSRQPAGVHGRYRVVWTMEYGLLDLPARTDGEATAGSTATIKTRCNYVKSPTAGESYR